MHLKSFRICFEKLNMKLSKLYTYYDIHLWTRIFYIFILSGYPVFVTLLVQEQDIYDCVKENAKFLLFFYPDTIGKKIITAFWVPLLTIVTHILGYFAKKDYYYLSKEKFVDLSNSLDEIVAKKSDRVGNAIKNGESDILKILSPQQQIKIILDEMYHLLKSIFSIKNDIAIRLWSIKNNKVKELVYSIPANDEIRTGIDILNSNNSELKKTLKTHRSTIIDDSKLSRDFIQGSNCADCDGCNLFTIPIIDNLLQNTYAILQIRIKFNKEKNVIFQAKNKKKYIEILNKYIKRINYEHRVYELYNQFQL